ncbi:MAG: DUF86 domain-containing protein [Planctomycetes bacterium]|nr:DUF86 domain-containing protein [Planctomycetota bacterium]
MWRDPATLLDIAKAVRLIQEFKRGLDRAAFLKDPMVQAAVLHEITVLGEAVKRLSKEFRESHPHIPWQDIAGMRDKLTHAYDKVNLNQVWDITESDIPQLKSWIDPLLPPKED